MKLLKLILLVLLPILFYSCGDCYRHVILQEDSSEIMLSQESSYSVFNDKYVMVLNESVTNCAGFPWPDGDTKENQFNYLHISLSLMVKDSLFIKKDYFTLRDSLNTKALADYLKIDGDFCDSLMLSPNTLHKIGLTWDEYKGKINFFAPFKLDLGYKTVEEDSMYFYFKDKNFNIEYFE